MIRTIKSIAINYPDEEVTWGRVERSIVRDISRPSSLHIDAHVA